MSAVIQFVAGVFFVGLGLYAFTSVLVPRWRACWRGSSVATGVVSNLGLGMTFLPMGLLMMLTDIRHPGPLAAVGAPILPGTVLVIVGHFLDFARKDHRDDSRR